MKIPPSFAKLSVLLLLSAAPLHAQMWSDSGTDWGSTNNWIGGVVPNTITANATFNSAISNQPDIGAGNYTINRLTVGSSSDAVTLSGSTGALTLSATNQGALLMSVAAGKSLTISSGVTINSALSSGTQWQPQFTTGNGSVVEFASGSTLTSIISSGTATSIAFQLLGSGTYNINGAFVGSNGTTFQLRESATLNWNPSSSTGILPGLGNAGGEGAQLNIYKSAGNLTFGSVGLAGTRTTTIRADGLTFGSTVTMGNATGASGFKNVLAIDDGTAGAISVNLTNLNLTSSNALGTNELFVGTNDRMTFSGTTTRGGGTIATTLTKSGAGTLTFSGNTASTITDAIVVSAGTFVLTNSASINNSSGVTVGAGATFVNNSSVSFTKDLSLTEGLGAAGSTINGTGTFAAANMTIASDLSDGFNSLALGNALLTKGGRLALTLTGITNGNYTLFSGGTISGQFTSMTINGDLLTADGSGNFSGSTGGYDYQFANGINQLSVVPEPSTWALLAFSLTAVTILRSRRKS